MGSRTWESTQRGVRKRGQTLAVTLQMFAMHVAMSSIMKWARTPKLSTNSHLPLLAVHKTHLEAVTNAHAMTSLASVGRERCVTERGTRAPLFRSKMPSHKTTPTRNAQLELSLLLQHYARHQKTLSPWVGSIRFPNRPLLVNILPSTGATRASTNIITNCGTAARNQHRCSSSPTPRVPAQHRSFLTPLSFLLDFRFTFSSVLARMGCIEVVDRANNDGRGISVYVCANSMWSGDVTMLPGMFAGLKVEIVGCGDEVQRWVLGFSEMVWMSDGRRSG